MSSQNETGFEPVQKARRRALQALYQWQLTGQDAGVILLQFRQTQDFKGVDLEYFEQLVRGVVNQREELDEKLQPFLDRSILVVDNIEKNVLRLGAWELLNEPQLQFRIIIDEAIDLAHRFGAEQGHAFVNGVLDKAARAWRPAEVGGA
ncbi:MAG TPA: transcription antitermination factor NusB [Xanthomonadales bacterium]|nr:transcription antitermination factor NusB [Xanthomonadales bacterium]